MEFGENALKNKIYPLINNQPKLGEALINKPTSTWSEAVEGMMGERWGWVEDQRGRFFPEANDNIPNNYSLYGPAEPIRLNVDPEFKVQLADDFKSGKIPEEDLRYYPITKYAINQEDYNRSLTFQKQLTIDKELLNNSEWYKALGAGVLLPENFLMLPVGGAASTTLGYTVKGFSTAFLGMLALESSLEALRWPYDAESNLKEAAMNVGMTAASAGLFNAGIKFGTRTYSNKVLKNTTDNINEMNTVLFDNANPTKEQIAVQLAFKREKTIAKGKDFIEKKIPDRSTKIFTNNNPIKKFFLTSLPSPYKSWNNNFKGQQTYDYMGLLLNDHSMITAGNMAGFATPNSVYTLSKIRTGATVWKINNELNDLWALESGIRPDTMTTAGINRANIQAGIRNSKAVTKWKGADESIGTVDNWLAMVNYKAIKDPKLLRTPNEKRAAKLINEYFTEWEPLLRERGQIGSGKYWKARVTKLEKQIIELNTNFARVTSVAKKGSAQEKAIKAGAKVYENKKLKISEKEYIDFVTKEKRRLEIELEDARFLFEETKLQKVQAKNDPHYFARYWSNTKIMQNRDEFEGILVKWYRGQTPKVDPKTGQPIIRTEADLKLDAKNTTNLILNEADDGVNINELHIAGNVSKHSKGRELTIPNRLVVDFIETNPMAVIRSYDQRMTPRYEFDLMFGGKNIDELINEIVEDGVLNGMSMTSALAQAKNFRHSYDVMLRQNVRNPARWDTKGFKIATDIAGLWYLPNAVLGTISEPAIIGMNHGWRTTSKALVAQLNLRSPEINTIKQNMPKWTGEAFELAFFGAQHRFDGNSTFASPVRSGWENTVNSFYILNGLTHATHFLKNWEALSRAHTIIQFSKNWAKGSANDGLKPKEREYERLFLLRGGIDESTARIIAAAPVENTKKDGSGLFLANIDKWKGKVNDDVTTRFQAHMSNGILNTIIMATPADRPIIMDNVLYVRMSLAKFIPGLKEDPKFTGYARVESAVWSKPLQFYSYLLAATTKITGAVAQGMISNKQGDFVFLAALAFGAGNIQYQIRTPNWREDKATWGDVVARSIDYSGMLSIYSDAFYQGLHFAGEMGFKPTLETPIGEINPKFDTTDPTFGRVSAVAGLFGAVPSLVEEFAEITRMIYNGQHREVGAQFIGRLPFLNLFIFDKFTNTVGKVLR